MLFVISGESSPRKVSWLSSSSSLPFDPPRQPADPKGMQAPLYCQHFRSQPEGDTSGVCTGRKEKRLPPGGRRQPQWGWGRKRLKSNSINRYCVMPRMLETATRVFADASFLPFFSTVPLFAIEVPPVWNGLIRSIQASQSEVHFRSQTPTS